MAILHQEIQEIHVHVSHFSKKIDVVYERQKVYS